MNEIKRKRMINVWESLDNDTDRWRWFIGNKHEGIKIYIDTYSTFGVFKDQDEFSKLLGGYTFNFDNHIGQAGILLDTIGIDNEGI